MSNSVADNLMGVGKFSLIDQESGQEFKVLYDNMGKFNLYETQETGLDIKTMSMPIAEFIYIVMMPSELGEFKHQYKLKLHSTVLFKEPRKATIIAPRMRRASTAWTVEEQKYIGKYS